MEKTRAFLSLNLKDREIKKLAYLQEKLIKSLKSNSIKWENPDKFHLTLRFLGDLSEESKEKIIFTTERLKFDFSEINFILTGIGFFPNMKRPRVIYFDLKEMTDNCGKLVGFIDKIIGNFGVRTENRFTPHITAGRFQRNSHKPVPKDLSFEIEPYEISFNSFYLMRSELKPSGSVYSVIREFKFNN